MTPLKSAERLEILHEILEEHPLYIAFARQLCHLASFITGL